MQDSRKILILNPNSNATVTKKMAEAIEGFGNDTDVEFVCETLESAPYGIESQSDIDAILDPVCRRIAAGNELASVIACYSDPGLDRAKCVTSQPVFGIQESGIRAAIRDYDSFGVIALSEASKARHLIYIEKLGHSGRLAGERIANLTVAESASGDETFAKLMRAGEALRDQDSASVIILGCAGMARHRRPLEEALGLPVIDPVQAAATRALEAVT